MRSKWMFLPLVFLLFPPLGNAQIPRSSGRAGKEPEKSTGGPMGTVSVSELRVPEKARKSFEKGMRLLARKESGASIEEFRKAIEQYPSYSQAYYEMGTAQLDLGDGHEAGEAFLKAIETSDGHFARAYFALSMVESHDNRFAEAETLARTGLSVEPDSSIGQFSLGGAQWGLGRAGMAEKTLRSVLERHADFREARLLLIEMERRSGKLEELVQDIDAYLKVDRGSATSAQLAKLREEARLTLARSATTTEIAAKAEP